MASLERSAEQWDRREINGTFEMYIPVLIQGIAWISAIEIFRLKILTLAVAGADFLRGPSLNVA